MATSASDLLDALVQRALDALEEGRERRLYRLEGDAGLSDLHVEAFYLDESLSEPWDMILTAVHPDALLPVDAWPGQPVTLLTRLADGSEQRRSGVVLAAAPQCSTRGLHRYQLRIGAWIALAQLNLRSQVWQDKTVVQLVDSVLDSYRRFGTWRWAPCVQAHLDQLSSRGVRPYTMQFRETDLAFVQRMLAEYGIGWRFEEAADGGPACLVFFADSTSAQSCPEDATSAAGPFGGIRFHRDGVQEAQDTVQDLGATRRAAVLTMEAQSLERRAARIIAAQVPTRGVVGGPNAPRIHAYDAPGVGAFRDIAEADMRLVWHQQTLEARHKAWFGRSGVRTLQSGTCFQLVESALDALDAFKPEDDKRFLVVKVQHVGINNLPHTAQQGIAAAFQLLNTGSSSPESVEVAALNDPGVLPDDLDPTLKARAAQRGYANRFEAIRANVPWRPQLFNDVGARIRPAPAYPGPLIGRVVGPDGSYTPDGASETYTNRFGQVLVRFEFQGDESNAEGTSLASVWMFVVQPFAGDGQGLQITPRIGHEVLVGHFDDDLEQPFVMCSLYNGRGEGGEPATPGGQAGSSDTSVFAGSTDGSPSGQGNLTGGNSPAWHGGAPGELSQGGQRNAAALSGYKSKEFGGEGYNQLVFDDSDGQLRFQLMTTHAGTLFGGGHLIHQQGNHRGSFRGIGWELRTDAFGRLGGEQGVLITTFPTSPAEPAGDNAAGIALAKQLNTLSQAFSQAARTHMTVSYSGMLGSFKTTSSAMNPQLAPIPAWLLSAQGLVDPQSLEAAQADAQARTTGGDKKLPHGSDATIQVTAKGGAAIAAGQDIILAAGENIHQASGENTDQAVGGALRLHTGQAIGILGGAIKPGTDAAGTGVTLIAGKDNVEMQAQAGTVQIAAKNQLAIQSQLASIDFAAAKKVTVATAGGARITVEGGNILMECPGTLTIKAGTKSFEGPAKVDYPLPAFPGSICIACLKKSLAAAPAFTALE